jgi:predicted nucleic acid-binding protein
LIRYLIDSSALWRILRDDQVRMAWAEVITVAAIGSCHPQRLEFRRSARDTDEYEQMSAMFGDLFPDVPVPKNAWLWADAAQHRMLRGGAHRSMSAVDLMICATAALRGLVVLHDDKDFTTAAQRLTDLDERRVRAEPPSVGPLDP